MELTFEQSGEIAELSKALCKAQGAMTGAVANSENPFFKSRYADLSAVWEDIRKPFTDNGLSVLQLPSTSEGSVSVTTQITHNSGQYIRSTLTMPPTKGDPQGIGSTLTYARRYGLAAMAGVYQIDDDANSARAPVEKITADQVKEIQAKIASAEIDEDKFLAWLKRSIKADSFEEINTTAYETVVRQIDAAIKRNQK